MKVGFLGNSNNYPFMLARAMRRAGHDVVFVLNQRIPLNRPEHRYDDVDPGESGWIVDAGDLGPTEKYQFLPDSPRRDEIIALLRTCDAVVLNHAALSLALQIDRPHLALLTGTDIQDLADPAYARHAEPVGIAEKLWLQYSIARQRAGIASAVAVSTFFQGLVPRYDAALDGLGIGSDRRFFCWMSDPHHVREATAPTNERVRIFNIARFTWKRVGDGEVTADHKALDVMIQGLGKFAERHPTVRLDIRFAEKGSQVDEAKELVKTCGLSEQVTWLKEMSQREVLEECRRADIVFDQMGLSIVAMGGLDVMALGRPLIANARPDVMRHHVAPPPICQAATSNEVLAQLERLVPSREERARVGRASRAYVEEHCSADKAAALCVERLGGVVSNSTRYSSWQGGMMEARERLVEQVETLATAAEGRVAEREQALERGELSLLAERHGGILARENYLAVREEYLAAREAGLPPRETQLAQREVQVAVREVQVAQREIEAAERGAQAASLEALAVKSYKEYESLRVVRWQRALRAWKERWIGRADRT